MSHWHYAHTLPGYDPDSPDSIGTASSMADLAWQLHTELDQDIQNSNDSAYTWKESAKKFREQGNDEGELGALREFVEETERAEKFWVLSQNLNRSDTPLYKNAPELWEQTVARMIPENFPLDVAHNSVLKVWECTDPETCELIEYECAVCGDQITWSNQDRTYINAENFSKECDSGLAHSPVDDR